MPLFDSNALTDVAAQKEKWNKTTRQQAINRVPERYDDFSTMSGVPIQSVYTPQDVAEMADIFKRLGFAFGQDGAGELESFVVTPPSYRFDIAIEEDLIEEIARVYGFERIPSNPPVAPAVMHTLPEGRRGEHALRRLLAGRDFTEVVNYSFVEEAWESDFAGRKDPIRVRNPIAAEAIEVGIAKHAALPAG